MNRKLLVLIICFQVQSIVAVTLVYNLRVRRIFDVPAVLERLKARKLLSVVPIFFSRSSHIVENSLTATDVTEKRRAGGMLVNMRYVPNKHWWMEATTGFETDHASFVGTDTFHASRAGLDDIVLSAGYRHFLGDGQLVGYGLVGLPTKWSVNRCDTFSPLLGTRVYSLGFGAEGSYSFLSSLQRSLAAIAQYRFIHGFDRNWFPILPEGSRIQPGNVQDILLTLQYREKRTIVELGYNATIFSKQAIILPTMQKIKTKTFVRHGGYVSISHGWFEGLFGQPFIIGAGCNFNHTNRFDAKTITGWIYGTVVF